MKIITKITALLAAAIGLMAVVNGSIVLFGFSDPGYPYFNSLIIYNIIIGGVSIFTSIYIWQNHKKALFYSLGITTLHILVLLSLLTIFNNIISEHSIGAMTFRSAAWVIFSIAFWKGKPNNKESNMNQ